MSELSDTAARLLALAGRDELSRDDWGMNERGWRTAADKYEMQEYIAACRPQTIAALARGYLEMVNAAIAYEDAIRACANDPEKMASFCNAEGDDLYSLYATWMILARTAIATRDAP